MNMNQRHTRSRLLLLGMKLFKHLFLVKFNIFQSDIRLVLCHSYQRVNRALDSRIPNNAVGSFTGMGGSDVSHIGEVFFDTW